MLLAKIRIIAMKVVTEIVLLYSTFIIESKKRTPLNFTMLQSYDIIYANV